MLSIPTLRSRTSLWALLVVALCFALSYGYLFPASEWLFTGRHPDRIVGDGVDDIQGLVWAFHAMVRTLREHPSWYLFGGIHTYMRGAPEGMLLWMPWVDRLFVPLVLPFTTDATLTTAMDMVYYATSFAAMYFYGREMRWSRALKLAAAIAFAFTPYARARAAVHPAFVAIFFVPLLFSAIERICREGTAPFSWKHWRIPALLLLLVGFSSHYYLFVTIVMAPLLLVYALVRARFFGAPRLVVLARLALAGAPLALFLAWNFLAPSPPGVHLRAGNLPGADMVVNNHYLRTFSALPVDYLTLDVKYGAFEDIIPPRRELTHFVAMHGPGNAHERTNGIRWSVLAVAVGAVGATLLANLGIRRPRKEQHYMAVLALLALYAFVLSLGPQWLTIQGKEYGPSQFVMNVLPNFRVASRWGPVVNFGVVCVAAACLQGAWERKTWLSSPRARWLHAVIWLVPAIVVVEYLPRNPLTTAALSPIVPGMPTREACGTGIFLPYSAGYLQQYETTRGTSCGVATPDSPSEGQRIETVFGGEVATWARPVRIQNLVRSAQCSGLSWVAFQPDFPPAAAAEVCNALGWSMSTPRLCRSASARVATRALVDCL